MKRSMLSIVLVLVVLVLTIGPVAAGTPAEPPGGGPVPLPEGPAPAASLASPAVRAPAAAVSLALDDGTPAWLLRHNYQVVYFNRFTPAPSEFPFELQQVWTVFIDGTPYNSSCYPVAVGDAAQFVIYQDTDGDGDPSDAELVATYDVQVQALYPNGSMHTLSPPLVLDGPGDVLIGVIHRWYPGNGSSLYDCATVWDGTDDHSRSWLAEWSSNAPNPPTMPPDSALYQVGPAFAIGDLFLRGYGQTVDPDRDSDGWTVGEGDCNDNDQAINPGATETWYDGVDQDCDGASDYDQDGDGYDSSAYSGTDCDDVAPAINPSAAEVCDGTDNDCDGQTDEVCLHVDRITGQVVLTRTGLQLRAYAYMAGIDGAAVPGCAVQAEITVPGKAPYTASATTNSTGGAYFADTARQRGLWQVCVVGASLAGYTFAPGAGDCKSWNY